MNPNESLFFLAKRFVAGTTQQQALAAVKKLNAEGMTATLDFLGEDVHATAEANSTLAAYLQLIEAIAREGHLRTNLSIKLSALGLHFEPEQAMDRLSTIVKSAQQLPDPFVRVDMERADTVDQTLQIVEAIFAQDQNIGIVLQAYLRRTHDDIERSIASGMRIRLCKGAYHEPAHVALQQQTAIRNAYLRFAERLLAQGRYPGLATHDKRLIEAICRYVSEAHIEPHQFEFQMLYGVRPSLQKKLVAQGYQVRIYVPFGTHWSGYMHRRITERKENALFALGAIFTR